MSHGYERRAPWETLEQEARENGYSRSARGDGVRYYSRGGGQQIDRRAEQLRRPQRHCTSRDEYCYGGTERTQWHDHDDSIYDALFDEYCPPTHYNSRALSDPYFNDRPGYQDWHYARARVGDAFAYGVGYPDGDNQRSRGEDASSPPLAITTDDSSNTSQQRYVGGMSLDDEVAFDGYAPQQLRRRTQSLDADALFDGYGAPRRCRTQSLDADAFDGYAPQLRRRTQSLDADAFDGYAPRRRRAESPTTPSCFDGGSAGAADSASCATKGTMIEIAPGVKMLLRGARETWDAYRRKFCVSVTCIGCSTKIFCIQDADCVLCPVCRVVNPLLETTPKPSKYGRRIGGLGLGFTCEGDLCRPQREAMKIAQLSKPT